MVLVDTLKSVAAPDVVIFYQLLVVSFNQVVCEAHACESHAKRFGRLSVTQMDSQRSALLLRHASSRTYVRVVLVVAL